MNCENCNDTHIGEYGSGRFCGAKGARGFSTKQSREEINKKVSQSLTGRVRTTSTNAQRAGAVKGGKTNRENRIAHYVDLPFDSLPPKRQRMRIFDEQAHACRRCKNKKWQDELIPLEIEHIDGNNQNNDRENLELLCPNCHALTETWRGRNKRKDGIRKRTTDAEFLVALESHSTVRQALLSLGLTPKGGNYFRAHRLLVTKKRRWGEPRWSKAPDL